MLGNLMLDQRLRSRSLRGFTRRGARERLGSSANLTSMVGSHNLTSNLEQFESRQLNPSILHCIHVQSILALSQSVSYNITKERSTHEEIRHHRLNPSALGT